MLEFVAVITVVVVGIFSGGSNGFSTSSSGGGSSAYLARFKSCSYRHLRDRHYFTLYWRRSLWKEGDGDQLPGNARRFRHFGGY